MLVISFIQYDFSFLFLFFPQGQSFHQILLSCLTQSEIFLVWNFCSRIGYWTTCPHIGKQEQFPHMEEELTILNTYGAIEIGFQYRHGWIRKGCHEKFCFNLVFGNSVLRNGEEGIVQVTSREQYSKAISDWEQDLWGWSLFWNRRTEEKLTNEQAIPFIPSQDQAQDLRQRAE